MSAVSELKVEARVKPVLDQGFVPAAAWNRAFRELAVRTGRAVNAAVRLEQTPGVASVYRTVLLPEDHALSALNRFYMERIVKFLLWQRGGWKISISGAPAVASWLGGIYSPKGQRAFDSELIGRSVYGRDLAVDAVAEACDLTGEASCSSLGRHLDGCRIGFDLGGSDRKCAAVIDGKMVHSEEVKWDPYFEKDPAYHWAGIQDSLKRAAAHLPRVDAIGGSAAGIYVNNEVRVASLFRGVPKDVFDSKVRRMFIDIGREWNVPLDVVNDGEVTALAGSMSGNMNAVLGVAMGTSEAAGYVTPDGVITSWLNELAFAPIDYRADAPRDEWSGDAGCGVQYLSQQAVGRLCGPAGIDVEPGLPLAEQLVLVQDLMKAGDIRAKKIYETIGVYLGYAIAHYSDFFEIENMLMLGRVMSGSGGDVIMDEAAGVLKAEYPELAEQIRMHVPDEAQKRHGQAVAAASIPELRNHAVSK